MEDKKRKHWFLILLLLMFVSGWGLLSISRELPFSHDPIEDDTTVYRITEDEDPKEKDAGDGEADEDDAAGKLPSETGKSFRRPQTEGSQNGIPACVEDCDEQTKEKQKLNFNVRDETGDTWERVGDVNIFANEEYEGRAIIAPESTGVYRFFIANEESRAVRYRIEAREEAEMKLPMLYRLKCNGSYVSGWQDAHQIAFDMERLEPGKRDILELEWKWQSSEKDSEIGKKADDVQYHLYLRLQAEGVSS